MHEHLRFTVVLYRRVALGFLITPAVSAMWLDLSPRVLLYLGLLQLAFVWHWLTIAAVAHQFHRWSATHTVAAFCLAEWSAGLALNAVEPWTLHVTPIMSLGPVILAAGLVNVSRFRAITVGCTITVAAMVVISRSLHPAVLYLASPVELRDVVSLVATPLLTGLVAYVAWLNQHTLFGRRSEIDRSTDRLSHADELAQRSIAREFGELERHINDTANGLSDVRATMSTDANADAIETLMQLAQDIQSLSVRVRTTSHSLGLATFSLRSQADIAATHTEPVNVRIDPELGDYDPVVEAVIGDVLRDVFVADAAVELEVGLDSLDDTSIGMHIAPVSTIGDDALVVDRVAAVGGTVRTEQVAGGAQLICVLPRHVLREQPPTSRRTVRADLGRGALFPIVAVLTGLTMWATVIPESDMLLVVGLIAVLYTGPCIAAWWLSIRMPSAGLMIFALSHWVTAMVVADRLNIVKYFVPTVLLVPLLVMQPHVRRATYGVAAVATSVVIGISLAIARLGGQIQSADEASDLTVDLVLFVMVPLATVVVVSVSWSNHTVMADAGRAATVSRRLVVEAADATRRSIERDLHDVVQQRLVSAALRTTVASKLTDPEARDQNLDLAVEQLRIGARAVDAIASGRPTLGFHGGNLATALESLAASSPIPVSFATSGNPAEVHPAAARAVWLCANEALGNAIKHAGSAARCEMKLEVLQTHLVFSFSDDGTGFGTRTMPGHGQTNMSDRIDEVGGVLTIESAPKDGCSITANVPLPPR